MDEQTNAVSNWAGVSGSWEMAELAEVCEVETRDIYRSPEEPSHVAWVGMWKAADGSISIRFPQITGNPGLEPSYAPWYGRANFADYAMESWEEFASKGAMITGPEDALSTTRVDFITMITRDEGETWEVVKSAHHDVVDWSHEDTRGYNGKLVLAANGKLVGNGMATVICRDGRIVDTHSFPEWTKSQEHGKYVVGIRESFDQGESWSEMQWVSGKFTDGTPLDLATEEHDFVELDDGRLLFIVRVDQIQHPVAAWLKRGDDGRYACEEVQIIETMPHSGMPDMVRTQDGIIWYWGVGHFYSLDDGRTWRRLPDSQFFAAYYGKMLAAGNHVLCVTQKDVSDSPYPVHHDGYIQQIRFSGRRIEVAKQTSSKATMALMKCGEQRYGDMHLRVDVRTDKADGMAFRISPDGRSYYAFMIISPGSQALRRWEAPPLQGATLSAYFPGLLDEHVRERMEKGIITIQDYPMAVLARIDEGQITVMRGLRLEELRQQPWVQLQVKAKGTLIQAAVSDGCSPPTYIGIHDAAHSEGSVGLLTDGGSVGAFKNLCVWPKARMIRDNWTDVVDVAV